MLNQRGGIISKVILIPAGVVAIIGVFLLGYYAGREQARKTATAEKPAALPEVVSQYLPKVEDFTFYKTLTEKGEKTVSIDLKPRPRADEGGQARPEGASPAGEARPTKQETPASPEAKAERPKSAKQQPQTTKTETPAAKQPASKLRYTIQVGSYPEKAMAEEEMKNMKKRGYAAFLVATAIPEKGTWYRVRVGSFANKQSAEKLAKELKAKEGIAGFITTE